jgi:hypothetical protein
MEVETENEPVMNINFYRGSRIFSAAEAMVAKP